MAKGIHIKNNQSIDINTIPVIDYVVFGEWVLKLLQHEENHCVNYYAYQKNGDLIFIIAIANDVDGDIIVFAHQLKKGDTKALNSLTQYYFCLHIFEREIAENFGIDFINHPWLKPVRFASNRANQNIKINDYPFYTIESEELHEVGVGPIHAGIIEPGHFRFICNGENVLHLEIQLGWQHRGIENLFLTKQNLLQQTILAENISGDSVVGHSLAFTNVIESLANQTVAEQLNLERSIALELERIAIHVNDISGLCTDVGYVLGANTLSVLRTIIINFTQRWAGNRLGKGLIRVGGTNFQLTPALKEDLLLVLKDFETRFIEIARHIYTLPSIENRFDNVGTVTKKQAKLIGAVGLTAKMAGLKRDIRTTHPFAGYSIHPYKTATIDGGDVYARFLLKRIEIRNSIRWIRTLLKKLQFNENVNPPNYQLTLTPNAFTVSLTEGWRGEICHCAITNSHGELKHYKIKDPSIHNWKALELSLRNTEISDFPINNKSYNLSYCGHDL